LLYHLIAQQSLLYVGLVHLMYFVTVLLSLSQFLFHFQSVLTLLTGRHYIIHYIIPAFDMFLISARNLNSLTGYCNLILLHLAEKHKDD